MVLGFHRLVHKHHYELLILYHMLSTNKMGKKLNENYFDRSDETIFKFLALINSNSSEDFHNINRIVDSSF